VWLTGEEPVRVATLPQTKPDRRRCEAMSLRPSKMPVAAVSLIPLAERWAIGDDFEISMAIDQASREDLLELAHCFDDVDDSFWNWLAGPEARAETSTEEYIAMSILVDAFELAKFALEQQDQS
jgi:hypothetical protein